MIQDCRRRKEWSKHITRDEDNMLIEIEQEDYQREKGTKADHWKGGLLAG